MSYAPTGVGTPVGASDAERGQAAEVFRTGYADGWLTRAELASSSSTPPRGECFG